MSTCKDCIHEKVCDNLIPQGLPWEDGKYPAEKWCDHFKPTADVVEVVRCKDCVFASVEDGKIKCYNTFGLLVTKETEYCSRGRRSENGT